MSFDFNNITESSVIKLLASTLGMTGEWSDCYDRFEVLENGKYKEGWNPFNDNSAAFSLQVNHGLQVHYEGEGEDQMVWVDGVMVEYPENKYAFYATRLGIILAILHNRDVHTLPEVKKMAAILFAEKIERDKQFEIMDAYHKQMKQEAEEQSQKDNEVLEQLKPLISEQAYKHIIEEIHEEGWAGDFSFVAEPSGTPQDNQFEYGNVYINQSCGIAGDDFSGTLAYPLPDGRYFQTHFSC